MKTTVVRKVFLAGLRTAFLVMPMLVAAQNPTTDAGTLDETRFSAPARPYGAYKGNACETVLPVASMPHAGRRFPSRPFFGATHLHTSFSMGVGAFGATIDPRPHVRVIQIPTARWTAYDAKYFNIDVPSEVAMTAQERAYTAPIWYTRVVKKLMRLPDGKNGVVRRAARESEPGLRRYLFARWSGTTIHCPCLDDSSRGDGG